MRPIHQLFAATLAGALLCLASGVATAHGRDADDRWERPAHGTWGWGPRHHPHHHDWRGPAMVYNPYDAPPPPPVAVYSQPAYGYRTAPVVTIGLPPIVIPLR